ncbi:MAG: UDP-2,3-diacylglucosamine diphosphatase [Chitinispirillales bacterium]|jgi:UDP-2,3-diacylglucosamine hydrolase|nr:UDP-2,3-diacylglucosamine diphosphatase [Chitinispirillales bacterium]
MSELKFFVSDFHFGSNIIDDGISTSLFDRFCSSLPYGSNLYILGDLFDFWIEHRYTVRADFAKIYSIFINAKKHGIKIFIVRGNHDFMYGDFLKKLGIESINDMFEFEIAEKKVCCLHGDEIFEDPAYNVMKSVFRNKILQSLYKSIHPTFSISLAQSVSKLSRKKNKKSVTSFERKERYRKYAADFSNKKNYDILIMGHSHICDLVRINSKIYANSGVWFEKPTYVLIDENKIFLKEFFGDLESDAVLEEVEI